MNNYETPEMITVTEHLKVEEPSINIEVTAVHTSDEIEVTNTAEYTSSNVWHYPAMKALGGVAIGQGEFYGDPSNAHVR